MSNVSVAGRISWMWLNEMPPIEISLIFLSAIAIVVAYLTRTKKDQIAIPVPVAGQGKVAS